MENGAILKTFNWKILLRTSLFFHNDYVGNVTIEGNWGNFYYCPDYLTVGFLGSIPGPIMYSHQNTKKGKAVTSFLYRKSLRSLIIYFAP